MTADPVRVCHVVNAVDTTSVPADIARGLENHTDVDADIIAWFHGGTLEDAEKVAVHTIGAPDTTLGVDRESYGRLRTLLADYDVVQTHHNHSGTFAKIAAARLGKKIVSTEQNTHGGFTRKGRFSNGVTNWWADAVTCVSDAVYDSIRSWEWLFLDGDDVHVIYNAVDLDRIREALAGSWDLATEAALAEDSTVVANAAMFTEQKAQDTLIRAVAATDSDVELVIAGDGALRGYLEDIARKEGVRDRVHLLGLIDRTEVYQLIDQADIYAMPSRWEGFSAAAIEAMAIGTPCVFSNIDEFADPFGDVSSFHPVDDADALADCIDDLAGNAAKRATLGEDGRELAQDYSLETIAGEYRELYLSLGV
jgi:glycosyltransferase involved in cell wall biosynthesis